MKKSKKNIPLDKKKDLAKALKANMLRRKQKNKSEKENARTSRS